MYKRIVLFSLLLILFSTILTAQKSVFGDQFLYPEEEYAYAKKYLANGEFEKAITAYRQLINDFPRTSYLTEAWFMIGYTYNNNMNDTAKAAETYRYLIKNYPKSEFTPSAKFELEHLGQPDFLPEFDGDKQ